ncbi:hypothetical protein TNIN_345311 [Trichonephila inaurata madagascariensis]|uniref:Uncharacterized protein n=1 Tax=Trichonephila inaurata madagascariensis TaxID=2747483 RepID=A0A8X7CNK3_9ARAC|nr:hypothetical protein TNIN_345311 [Trichonephila inaurata madagascariensis]
MALDQQSNMELEPQSPYSTSSTETAPLSCEEFTSMKVYIRRLQIICTVSLFRLDHGHSEADSINSHGTNSRTSRALSNKRTPPPSRTRRNGQHKRKDEDYFEFPLLRKTARIAALEPLTDLNLQNQFSLLPNALTRQISGQTDPTNISLTSQR